MNKIVLDTNCLVVSVSPSSKYHIVWDKLEKGEYDLFVTDEIIYEIRRFWSISFLQKLLRKSFGCC